jgi:hypothetical protein
VKNRSIALFPEATVMAEPTPTPKKYTREELDRIWREFTENARPPDWILEMTAFYYRTRTVRSVDHYRLLGDQSRGVDGSEECARETLLGKYERKDDGVKPSQP